MERFMSKGVYIFWGFLVSNMSKNKQTNKKKIGLNFLKVL